MPAPAAPARPSTILAASLVGTTIEYFDFYIYGTAAVLVFPQLYFPASDPMTARLAALASFGIAFVARPIGSIAFGHFGDRIGRKATLVAALLLMGAATVAIGLLPTYHSIGVAAPVLLSLCRFGQGLGLGGEWSGAVLLATENAPPGRRAWYGMFPQLGAPLGFVLSTGIFLLLSGTLTDEQFLAFGWRLPFVASAVLVLLGLYVRLAVTETRAFASLRAHERVAVPFMAVVRDHPRALAVGTMMSVAVFVIFYLMTVFALGWGTTVLGYTRPRFLQIQLVGVACCLVTIPVAAALAERGRRRILIASTAGAAVFGLVLAPLFQWGTNGALFTLALGLGLMGLMYGPLGTVLSELFPTEIRYTGTSLSLNLAGILGGSLGPYTATWLAGRFGLESVGYYLTASALVTLLALLATPERGDEYYPR